MAWVDRLEIERKPGTGRLQPTQVTAHIKVFAPSDFAASPIVQIDTFGLDGRKNPGKQSQTLQMGREAASELFSLLRDVYGFR